MEKKFYYNLLYDCYKNLLTEKQRKYYEDYYFNDYSLQEISENENITRNAVHKQLKSVIRKLKLYEDSLHIYNNHSKIKEIIEDLDEDIKKKIENYL